MSSSMKKKQDKVEDIGRTVLHEWALREDVKQDSVGKDSIHRC